MASNRAPRPTSPDDPVLDGWYHTIDFGHGIVSRGHFDHRSVVGRYGIPASLEGLSALDVGAGDGFFSLELERRGASRVVAVDVDTLGDSDWLPATRERLLPAMGIATWREHFGMARDWLGSNIERQTLSVYDLTPERVGMFDVVFCADVLLHLKNPLQALLNIRAVTRLLAIIESPIEPSLERESHGRPYLQFGVVDEEPNVGDHNTYWKYTSGALRDMMLYAGFARALPQPQFALPPFGLDVVSVVGHVT